MKTRTRKSMINMSVSALMYIVGILVNFVTQRVFISSLGDAYNGINSLFGNILSILAIVELGFGSAIVYNLYKPVEEDNKAEICTLMAFYKKIYTVIALAILCLGICVLPFLNSLMGDTTVDNNIHLLFVLFMMDTVASYLLTYKRSLLYANQKVYVINLVHMGYLVLMNVSHIAVLWFFKSYILYLVIKVVFRVAENLILNVIVDRTYPYIKTKEVEPLKDAVKNDIINKVKGLFFHKIGTSVVLGTDSLIIAKVVGVVSVGLYGNYDMIFKAVKGITGETLNSLTSSVGNLLVHNDKKKTYHVFKDILYINGWMSIFVSTCVFCMLEPFVILWIDEEHLLGKGVFIVLVINLFVQCMRYSSSVFKEAAGIFYEDRFVPVIESVANIIFSLIFAEFFGMAGVFIGTICSTMVLFLYSYPVYVYGKIMDKKYYQYMIDHAKYIILFLVCIVPTYVLTEFITFDNVFLQLVVNGCICLTVPNIIYFMLTFKTDEFRYLLDMVKGILGSKKKIVNEADSDLNNIAEQGLGDNQLNAQGYDSEQINVLNEQGYSAEQVDTLISQGYSMEQISLLIEQEKELQQYKLENEPQLYNSDNVQVSEKKKYDYLDLLKAIAIFLVVMYHAFSGYVICPGQGADIGQRLLYFSHTICTLGVPIFFIVNGGLLLNKKLDVKKHYSKMLRMGIITIIWACITLLILSVINNEYMSVKEFIVALYSLKLGWINHLWFMQALLLIYMVFPIIKWLYDKYPVWFYAALGLGFLVTFGVDLLEKSFDVYNAFNNTELTVHIMLKRLKVIYFSYAFVYFMLGAILFRYRDKKSKIVDKVISVHVFVISIAVLVIYGIIQTIRYNVFYDTVWEGYDTITAFIAAIALYFIVLGYKHRVRYNGKMTVLAKFISCVGANTLGIYFIHMMIVRALQRVAVEVLNVGLNTALVENIIISLLSFFISYVLVILLKKLPIINKLFMG